MRFAVTLVLLLLVFVPASFVLAESTLPSQLVPCDGPDCTLCSLVELAQRLINGGIFIMVIISAMMFAYAGMLHLVAGGDAGKAAKARSIFTHVGGGLVIILVAWLGVDTLMKTMVDQNGPMGPWNSIGCTQQASFTR